MTEEGHSISTTKDSKIAAEVTSPSTSPPWFAEEQKVEWKNFYIMVIELQLVLLYYQQLEKALRTFPQSEENRWDKIASMVPSRSRQECIRRYKVTDCKFKGNILLFWSRAGTREPNTGKASVKTDLNILISKLKKSV